MASTRSVKLLISWLTMGCFAQSIASELPAASDVDISKSTNWKQHKQGFESKEIESKPTGASLFLIKFHTSKFKFRVINSSLEAGRPETIKEATLRTGALAGINGGYFDDKFKPLGLLMTSKKQVNPKRKADWGILTYSGQKVAVVHSTEKLPSDIEEALQCGPRLVIRGKIPQFKDGIAFRSGVCIFSDKEFAFVVAYKKEISLKEFAESLKEVGCRDALNLDGGTSTQFYTKQQELELDLPAPYGIPSSLIAVPK